ncbi:MAG: hypothetical protein AAGK32_10520, partial [Actinomycetota bacterium]
MAEKIPARFRKTKTDKWAVMAPVEDLEKALADGGKIDVLKKSGDWSSFRVASLGRPFDVDGGRRRRWAGRRTRPGPLATRAAAGGRRRAASGCGAATDTLGLGVVGAVAVAHGHPVDIEGSPQRRHPERRPVAR